MATPTYTLIDSVTLGSSASSVTFSSISAVGKGDLVLVVDGTMDTRAGLKLQFNGDTNDTNTFRTFMYGNGSGASAGTSGYSVGNLGTTSSSVITQIFDYAATDKHTSILSRYNEPIAVAAVALRWANTAAINQIKVISEFGAVFAVGCTFHIYQLVSE